MGGSLEIHVNLAGKTPFEKICDTIDRLREKYPKAKIIIEITSGVFSYGRE